ncbi:MAG: hypothetical protein EA402_01990 [Planctomycetota bacterium]|nr:MAG: hypothetical protein EA402_01990 [Planctomycetota bacterium]
MTALSHAPIVPVNRKPRSLLLPITLAIILLILASVVARLAHQQRPHMAVAGIEDSPPVLAEMDVGELAGTLMLAGFRGLAIDLLWMRATSAKDAGRFYESVALFQLISKTQPQFETVWEYMAWDMAYNIASEVDGREAKFAWFLSGLQAAVEGSIRNPRAERLMRYLAWMFIHRGSRFVPEVEAIDWGPLLNPLLAPAGLQAPEPGASPYAIGATIYRFILVNEEVRGFRVPAFVRRILPLNYEHDGNLARNRGRHREAMRHYLQALDAWRETYHWAEARSASFAEREAAGEDPRSFFREYDQVRITRINHDRQEGALRRKLAQLIRELASNPQQGESLARQVMDRDFEPLRQAIEDDAWWRSPSHIRGGIRWYTEESQ